MTQTDSYYVMIGVSALIVTAIVIIVFVIAFVLRECRRKQKAKLKPKKTVSESDKTDLNEDKESIARDLAQIQGKIQISRFKNDFQMKPSQENVLKK